MVRLAIPLVLFLAGPASAERRLAFVFFAGHGVEIAGGNYLLPIDIVAPQSGDGDFVASESIALSRLLDRIHATGARATIAVIDACRDNPFETSLGRSIGGTRGLGQIAAPKGAFVIFSAGAGQAALDRLSDDDPDPNSVFTRALLPRLSRPGLELRDLVGATRIEVRDLARIRGHDQFPAYCDELLGAFYLIPLSEAAARDPIGADFDLAREVGTTVALGVFLDRHGDRTEDFRVMLVRRMLAELGRPSPPPLNALGCGAGAPPTVEPRRPSGMSGRWSFSWRCDSGVTLAGQMEVYPAMHRMIAQSPVTPRDQGGRSGFGTVETTHRRIAFSIAWRRSPGERWRADLSADARTFSGRTAKGCTLTGSRID